VKEVIGNFFDILQLSQQLHGQKFMNENELQRIVDEKTQESSYLEFKRGDALDTQDNKKSELVKDVTAFANANGGRIIYGIGEEKVNGIGVADFIAPVTNATVTKEWITSVVFDKTSPRFSGFEVTEIALHEGRAIIVDIEAAGTAHQNLFDHRYHQRIGTVTRPLEDFQIRDLMVYELSISPTVRP
jgi:predicted HTH transcriptional regulator